LSGAQYPLYERIVRRANYATCQDSILKTCLAIPAVFHGFQIDPFRTKWQWLVCTEFGKIMRELLLRMAHITGEIAYFLGLGNN
jgi:hypothetical protein